MSGNAGEGGTGGEGSERRTDNDARTDNDCRDDSGRQLPPAVHSGPPEHELEEALNANPHDLDKKADVGSDESMDASDPPAASQPGSSSEPAPSSSFPE